MTFSSAALIEPDDPRWRHMLGRTQHDFYHLPDYVVAAAKEEGGRPAAFYAESGDTQFLVPLVVRDLPPALEAPADWVDVTTPYGYPSPIMSGGNDPAKMSRFFDAFRTVGRMQGVVSAFFRLHPLLELPDEVFTPFGQLQRGGTTVYLDLRRPSEELWSQTRRNHRVGVERLRSAGYVATLDDWSRYDAFIAAYRQTMTRVGASDFYFFSDEYFADLRAALGFKLHLCTVVSPAGELASGGLFCVAEGIVQYHLGATADGYFPAAPSKLMFDHVRRWAQERGSRVLHLGGGLGGREDSLFQFKAGFSPLRAEFRTFRMVLDEERYAWLEARWRESCASDGSEGSGYFPVYRRPRPAAHA